MKRRTRTTIGFVLTDGHGKETGPFIRTGIVSEGRPIFVTCSKVESVAKREYFMLLHFVREGNSLEFVTSAEIGPLDTRLNDGMTRKLWVPSWPYPDLLRIDFGLIGGIGFCEAALENLFEVLTSLGVNRVGAQEFIREFHISQTTEVKWRGRWVCYAQYLLLTLPVLKES